MFNSDQIRSLDKNMLVVMSTGEPSTYTHTHRWFQSHSIEKQEEEEKNKNSIIIIKLLFAPS